MSPVLLFDRVRLPDGREGTVIAGAPNSARVRIALQNGKTLSMMAAVLTPIHQFSPESLRVRVELSESRQQIERVAVSF